MEVLPGGRGNGTRSPTPNRPAARPQKRDCTRKKGRLRADHLRPPRRSWRPRGARRDAAAGAAAAPRPHAAGGGRRSVLHVLGFFSFFVSPAAAERSGAKLPQFRTRCINGFANLRHPKRYEDHRTPSPWCPSPSETPSVEKPAAGSRPRTTEPAAGPRRDAPVPNSRRAREIGAGGRPKMGQRVPVRATIRRGGTAPVASHEATGQIVPDQPRLSPRGGRASRRTSPRAPG